MEKIAMKCTREEYESMRQELLKANIKEDFELFRYCNNSDFYLTNAFGGNQLYFTGVTDGRRVYNTFNKDVFLKACGIKIKKDKREKMFKKTIKQLKYFHELNFDINTVDIEYGYFSNAEGEHERDGSCTITIKVNKNK